MNLIKTNDRKFDTLIDLLASSNFRIARRKEQEKIHKPVLPPFRRGGCTNYLANRNNNTYFYVLWFYALRLKSNNLLNKSSLPCRWKEKWLRVIWERRWARPRRKLPRSRKSNRHLQNILFILNIHIMLTYRLYVNRLVLCINVASLSGMSLGRVCLSSLLYNYHVTE